MRSFATPKHMAESTSNVPGSNAPLNKSTICTVRMLVAPKMIIAALGGNRSPMAPEEVMSASASCSGYLLPVRISLNKLPRAKIVTPDTPVNDVNSAATATQATAAPPRSQPTASFTKRSRRVPVLPRASSRLAVVKSGTATIPPVSVRILYPSRGRVSTYPPSTLSARYAMASSVIKSGRPCAASRRRRSTNGQKSRVPTATQP